MISVLTEIELTESEGENYSRRGLKRNASSKHNPEISPLIAHNYWLPVQSILITIKLCELLLNMSLLLKSVRSWSEMSETSECSPDVEHFSLKLTVFLLDFSTNFVRIIHTCIFSRTFRQSD